jgi:hypothetical protein
MKRGAEGALIKRIPNKRVNGTWMHSASCIRNIKDCPHVHIWRSIDGQWRMSCNWENIINKRSKIQFLIAVLNEKAQIPSCDVRFHVKMRRNLSLFLSSSVFPLFIRYLSLSVSLSVHLLILSLFLPLSSLSLSLFLSLSHHNIKSTKLYLPHFHTRGINFYKHTYRVLHKGNPTWNFKNFPSRHPHLNFQKIPI